MMEEFQKPMYSQARSVANLESEPSATMEAESILQSLLSSLSNPNFKLEELPHVMRKYMLSLRLLGINDEWARKELQGYLNTEKLPIYRQQYCGVEYIEAKSRKMIEEKRELYDFNQNIVFIVNHRETGWANEHKGPNKRLAGNLVSTKKRDVPTKWEIDMVLDRVVEETFDRASKTLVTARFGSAIDTIFRDYQKVVGSTLSSIEIEDHMDTAYRNLKGGNEANWRAAALACRNVLQDLSAKLWCVECDDYNMGGELISVKSDKVRNRLRAYMHLKGLNRDDTPVALLDPVYAQCSAAKTKCSYEDARSVLIVTYLFIAELIRQTDMKKVTKIERKGSRVKKVIVSRSR